MKRKPAIAGAKYETFDAIPVDVVHVGVGNDLYKGAHVRQYMSKLRTKVSGPSGEILYFVCPKIKGRKVWRAFVAWRPENLEHYDQFVDVGMLRLENTPPPRRKSFDVTDPNLDAPDGAVVDGWKRVGDRWEPEPTEDLTACPGDPENEAAACGGDLVFDPDLVGDTCGGNTIRGWNVCQKCGRAWITRRGIGYDRNWKLASGGRSVETGVGRIRVDGAEDAEALMARIVKLPDLELEVTRLRKQTDEPAPETPRGETSPWHECKLVVNGIDLRDGDRILKINQPETKDNGVYIIRLERP